MILSPEPASGEPAGMDVLRGEFRIKDADGSSFPAERAEQPDEPIPDPSSYRDKWRRRW